MAACLLKAPGARPSPTDLLRRLRGSRPPPSAAAERLQRANLQAVQRTAEDAAAVEAERTEAERRQDLLDAAEASLNQVRHAIREQLLENAPHASHPGGSEWSYKLGAATLSFASFQDASGVDWGVYAPTFDVIAHAGIELRVPPTYADYHGRGHSLWYCDAQQSGVFRWYETAFSISAQSQRRTLGDPVMLPPGRDAGGALSNVMTSWLHARPFAPIDQDDSSGFIERWLEWFADAIEGRLGPPGHVPELDPEGSYRI